VNNKTYSMDLIDILNWAAINVFSLAARVHNSICNADGTLCLVSFMYMYKSGKQNDKVKFFKILLRYGN